MFDMGQAKQKIRKRNIVSHRLLTSEEVYLDKKRAKEEKELKEKEKEMKKRERLLRQHQKIIMQQQKLKEREEVMRKMLGDGAQAAAARSVVPETGSCWETQLIITSHQSEL